MIPPCEYISIHSNVWMQACLAKLLIHKELVPIMRMSNVSLVNTASAGVGSVSLLTKYSLVLFMSPSYSSVLEY